MSRGNGMSKIRVVIADDSPVARDLLVYVLESDPRVQVVGVVGNGEEAIAAVLECKPDILIMDFHMPRMNGLEATRQIMETCPLPIVIATASSSPSESASAFQLLEAGALAIVEKPMAIDHPAHEAIARDLLRMVMAMSEIKVVRRWRRHGGAAAKTPPRVAAPDTKAIGLVAIGGSTGGTTVLKTILCALPRDFPVPILIVQHISAGFTAGLVEWLARASGRPVHIAAHGQLPIPGQAYVAPDGQHLEVDRDGSIRLTCDAPVNGHRPSVSVLFRSVAHALGGNAVGVLLTGMGKDGAAELGALRNAGAATIAQDKDSSVVHGMPGEAIRLKAAKYVLAADEIAGMLTWLTGKEERREHDEGRQAPLPKD